MREPARILIAAGGTGGHVFPALAVGEQLLARGCQLHWCGTRHGLESRVVPTDAYRLHWLPGLGVRGRSLGRRIRAISLLALAALRALWLMMALRPNVVLAMGGYVSAPVGVAAFLCRRPLVIHEQNAVPGLTNRLLAHLAVRVLEAVRGSFPLAHGAEHVGNPVRPAIAALADLAPASAAGDAPLTVLIFGGSQGAASINQHVPAALAAVGGGIPLRIVHQTGRDAANEVQQAYRDLGLTADVQPFIDDMASAYAKADVVIARAGAMSLAEILVAGVPAILIPYPHAVDDHQRANAAAAVAAGAALLVEDSALAQHALTAPLRTLLASSVRRREMRAAAHALAIPDAAGRIADILMAVAGKGARGKGTKAEVGHV